MAGKIENAIAERQNTQATHRPSVNNLMSTMLDGEGLRKRFDDLLGKRSAQFISSIVSLVNADANMQAAFYETPMSVIQAGLKAATFDLPIDQNLGYAYIVPFKNKGKMTANFILGWKGMHQLAIRTGAYKTINVVDLREGELKSYNRLTEEIEIDFIEDENEREAKPIIGYVGYYKLVNGAEKTIYMSTTQIANHEKKFRKGDYMGKGWKDDWDAMARKTVYRKLIGKWGVMSIEYQTTKEGQNLAEQMKEEYIDSASIDATYVDIDTDIETGEVTE
jgi:recombination protein RecT